MSKCETCNKMIEGQCTHIGRNTIDPDNVVPTEDWKEFKGSFPKFADYCSDEVIKFFEDWQHKRAAKVIMDAHFPPITPLPYTPSPWDVGQDVYKDPNKWHGSGRIPEITYRSASNITDGMNVMSISSTGDCPLC